MARFMTTSATCSEVTFRLLLMQVSFGSSGCFVSFTEAIEGFGERIPYCRWRFGRVLA